jgi:hypothetical protein
MESTERVDHAFDTIHVRRAHNVEARAYVKVHEG